MTATNERVERFKTEAAELNLKAGNSGHEAQLQGLGAALMVIGIIGAFVSYLGATGAGATGDVMEMVALGVAFLTLAIVGSALFLRYSLAKFLRFWLLRQLYEGQAHLDQVVEAIKQR
jgi:hypothetical protein